MSRLTDAVWEREFRRCRGDGTVEGDLKAFTYFCSKYVYIQHPEGRRLFELRDAQVETVRAYLEDDKVLVLKARQIGFTTVTMTYCLWKALFHKDFTVIALSKKKEDAVAALGMATFALANMDQRLLRRLPARTNDHQQVMTFANGSKVECHPSRNDPARSRTASLMILDEWAFMPDPEEAWAAVEPVTDVGGRLIALSTAKGYGNMFHKMWVESVKGENGFRRIFFPWSAATHRDADWYEGKKRSMPEWQLHQEYPSDPEEAFIKSGNSVFPLETLKALEMIDVLPARLVPDGGDSLWNWTYDPLNGGPLRVWEHPVPDVSYVIGADTAQGLEHGDYSSAHVIRVDTLDVVAHWHGHIDPDQFAEELIRLGRWYNTALVGPEVNSMGLSTTMTMHRHAYPRIYRRRSQDRAYNRPQEQLGFYTSKATKPKIIADLGASLREGELGLHCVETREELMTYVRKEDGSTSGSPYDDRVMSLAIAYHMVQFAYAPEQASPIGGPPAGSFAAALKQVQDARAHTQVHTIGKHNVRRAVAV